MPYISKHRRNALHHVWDLPQNAGELNYFLTLAVLSYLEEHGKSYQQYNDVLGVLAAMQQEIYRRLVAPYEDEKIAVNGDVF